MALGVACPSIRCRFSFAVWKKEKVCLPLFSLTVPAMSLMSSYDSLRIHVESSNGKL